MKRDSLRTQIARIAALRARGAYRVEKQRLLGELTEARRRGEDQAQFLAMLETDPQSAELLGRHR